MHKRDPSPWLQPRPPKRSPALLQGRKERRQVGLLLRDGEAEVGRLLALAAHVGTGDSCSLASAACRACRACCTCCAGHAALQRAVSPRPPVRRVAAGGGAAGSYQALSGCRTAGGHSQLKRVAGWGGEGLKDQCAIQLPWMRSSCREARPHWWKVPRRHHAPPGRPAVALGSYGRTACPPVHPPAPVLLFEVLHGAQGAQAASCHDAHPAAHSLALLHAAATKGMGKRGSTGFGH